MHVVEGERRKVCTTVCMLLEAHGERFVQLSACCWRCTEKGLYNCVHVDGGAWRKVCSTVCMLLEVH